MLLLRSGVLLPTRIALINFLIVLMFTGIRKAWVGVLVARIVLAGVLIVLVITVVGIVRMFLIALIVRAMCMSGIGLVGTLRNWIVLPLILVISDVLDRSLLT